MHILRCLLLLIFCAVFGAEAVATEKTEQYKINYLLEAVGISDLVFIRNGTEYNGKDARDHLQRKLNIAGNDIRTADDFIDYIASKSSLSGDPYYVRLADGSQIEAAIWLRHKLAGMVQKRIAP